MHIVLSIKVCDQHKVPGRSRKIVNINTLACGVWYVFSEKIFSHHMNLGQNSSHFVTLCHIFLIHATCDVSPMWDIFFHISSLIRCQELFSGKTITLFHITLTIKMHHYVKYYFFSVFKSIFFSHKFTILSNKATLSMNTSQTIKPLSRVEFGIFRSV